MALGAVGEKGGVMAYYPFTRPSRYNADIPYAEGSLQNFKDLNTYGKPAEIAGLQDLYRMLMGQGRVDPRLLAQLQAQNATSTQQQQDAQRGRSAGRGTAGGGLSQAINAAIGAAGSTRASNLNYQDIADSYKRQQDNLGLMNQLVMQPQLGYASLSSDIYGNKLNSEAQYKAARVSALGAGIAAGAGSGAGK